MDTTQFNKDSACPNLLYMHIAQTTKTQTHIYTRTLETMKEEFTVISLVFRKYLTKRTWF